MSGPRWRPRGQRRGPALAAALALGWLGLAEATARAELQLGAILGAHFFSADNELGRFDNGPPDLASEHGVMLGARAGWFPIERVGIEGEVLYNPTFVRGGNHGFQHVLHYRAHLRLNLLTGRLRPFLVAGGGASSLLLTDTQRYLRDDTDPSLHAGVGIDYAVGRRYGVRLDARILFPPSVGDPLFTEDFEVLLGFFARFDVGRLGPAPDRDHDGIPDPLDRCPEIAGPRENQGCPDVDTDGDGIVDRLDRCWSVPGIPEQSGCPDRDSDGDGLLDRQDKCPALPGPPVNDGCPDVDSDGDGIVDRLDGCPDQPETRNDYQDEDGCPDEIPIEVKRFTGIIRGIHFRTDSAEILADSFALLDEAAAVLAEHPEVKLEIAGHTDSQGSEEHNLKLSQDRAGSVRDYLVRKGIAVARLRAIGFGLTRPIDTNDTPEGRARNRRVEFTLVSRTRGEVPSPGP